MKLKLSITLLLITLFSFAQNKFEPGYYIDNSGKKTECLIKNYDWKNNPTSIEIKNSESDKEITTKNFEDYTEFGIISKSKFIKETIRMDKSSQNFNLLTSFANPDYIEKTVFLKVLVEGKSNLYYFEDEDHERFFYSVNDKIEQLIYKKYFNSDNNISTNESFKQQLFVNFKCNEDQKSILKLRYKESDLMDYFIKTNNCLTGNNEVQYVSKKRKFETNFKANILVTTINSAYTRSFGKLYSNQNGLINFGFEGEIILPYHNNNWAVIFDPSFVKDKESITYYDDNYIHSEFNLKNDSYTVRLPLGIRRYFRVNKNSSFFTNASFTYNLNKTNVYTYRPYNGAINVLVDDKFTSSSIGLGLGYQYKRYTAEIKYYTKTILYFYAFSGQEYSYSQYSLKLGYKLF